MSKEALNPSGSNSVPVLLKNLMRTPEGQVKLAALLAAVPVGLNVLAALWNASGLLGMLFAMLFTLVGSGVPWFAAFATMIFATGPALTGVIQGGEGKEPSTFARVLFGTSAALAAWWVLTTSWMALGIGAGTTYLLRRRAVIHRRRRLTQ
jgi:hypothetical protein